MINFSSFAPRPIHSPFIRVRTDYARARARMSAREGNRENRNRGSADRTTARGRRSIPPRLLANGTFFATDRATGNSVNRRFESRDASHRRKSPMEKEEKEREAWPHVELVPPDFHQRERYVIIIIVISINAIGSRTLRARAASFSRRSSNPPIRRIDEVERDRDVRNRRPRNSAESRPGAGQPITARISCVVTRYRDKIATLASALKRAP